MTWPSRGRVGGGPDHTRSGGVGPTTIALLIEQTISAAEAAHYSKIPFPPLG